MQRSNLNTLARDLCREEGGAIQLTAAQSSEAIRALRTILSRMAAPDALAMLARLATAPPARRTKTTTKGGRR